MLLPHSTSVRGRAAAASLLIVLLAACAAPKPAAEAEATPAAAPAATPVPEVKPVERPVLAPGAARARVQQLIRQVLESLNEGDEERAKVDLDEARHYEPDNKTVACLQRGITADPLTALGKESQPYTVQGGETLGRIAQRALGDTCEFYLLARYNQIRVPKQVAAGQVLRIPGKVALAAPDAAGPRRPDAVASDTARVTPTPAAPTVDTTTTKPVVSTPSPAPAKADIDRHHRAAQAAFRRQDLATAIREWGRVLELDPGNELARARRQEAIDLERRLKQMK